MGHKHIRRSSTRGNILFLILLAIVLFAALSYAVTSSMRGDGKDAGSESASAAASELINYAALVEQVVMRLKVVGGCTDQQISFETAGNSNYTNVYTPADGHCKVFDPAGGNVPLQIPGENKLVTQTEANALTWGGGQRNVYHFTNQICSPLAGTGTCTGAASEKELIIGVAYLRKDVCDAINRQLGQTSGGTGGYPIGGLTDYYKGIFFGSGEQRVNMPSPGLRTTCVYNSVYGNAFAHILVAR